MRSIVLLFATMWILIGCTRIIDDTPSAKGGEKDHLEEAENLVTAVVTEVVDGDTIRVRLGEEEETVRLLLVDTPETHHPEEPVEPWGPEAEAFAKEQLLGKKVQLEIGKDSRGKYDRLLAYVYVNGEMFNEMLLKEGLARVAYIYPPNLKYVDEFRDIESEAQRDDRNIWSVEGYVTNTGFNEELVQ